MSQYEKDAEDVKSFLKGGGRRAASNLVARHQNAVFRMCYSVIGDTRIAEEVAQDSFLKAFKKLSKIKNPRLFRSWILSIAYRASLDQQRKKKYHFDPIDEQYDLDDGSTPQDILISQDEQRRTVANAIKGLGNPDASIFVLFYMEELTTKEIAEVLGISKSNVKIKLMRGREKLKKKLTRTI